MTKPTKTADVSVEETTSVDAAQERADRLAQELVWMRERALSNALTLHKQNGGMIQPERIIEDARKFLAFTQG
jgi:hypothetical protein